MLRLTTARATLSMLSLKERPGRFGVTDFHEVPNETLTVVESGKPSKIVDYKKQSHA